MSVGAETAVLRSWLALTQSKECGSVFVNKFHAARICDPGYFFEGLFAYRQHTRQRGKEREGGGEVC